MLFIQSAVCLWKGRGHVVIFGLCNDLLMIQDCGGNQCPFKGASCPFFMAWNTSTGLHWEWSRRFISALGRKNTEAYSSGSSRIRTSSVPINYLCYVALPVHYSNQDPILYSTCTLHGAEKLLISVSYMNCSLGAPLSYCNSITGRTQAAGLLPDTVIFVLWDHTLLTPCLLMKKKIAMTEHRILYKYAKL